MSSYKSLLLIFGVVFACVPLRASVNTVQHPHSEFSGLVETGISSKYVSEGRDNLGEGSFLAGESVVGWENFALGIWWGHGNDVDYDELNFSLGYEFGLGAVGFYVNYTRLEFTHDDSSDNEFAVGASTGFWDVFYVATDLVYSTEADGVFAEFVIGADFAFFNEFLILSPYILEAVDFGYAGSDDPVLNNFQMGIGVGLEWSESLSFFGQVHYSIAQDGVRDDGLGDLTWVTAGLVWIF